MTDACTLPRQPRLIDTPHPQVGDMQREQIASLDLAGCNVLYVVVALNEFELQKKNTIGHRFETWPETIRVIMERELKAFQDRTPNTVIKGITQGVEREACVLAIHWRPKA